ncbi:MAG: ribonuclease E/G, partial [Flavobacteriales bacterium]
IKPKGFGIIIRTVAQGKKVADLDADLSQLVEKWKSFCKTLKVAKAPFKVLGEIGRASAILRDMLNDSFENIYVDDKELYKEVKDYLGQMDASKTDLVKYEDYPTGIFERFGIERQIKASFGRNVSMKKGAYLVIEHTEALHVVDVNSGNRSDKTKSQEENALSVNLLAAEEVARQLRLRDMGGIIVVDFIDLQESENRKKLYEALKGFMADDRAKHKVLPPSRFGLIEITRQRVRPEVKITTVESCPTCKGKGKVEASILIDDEIEDKLDIALAEEKAKALTLVVHPFIHSYFTKGLLSKQVKMMWKHKKRFTIKPNSAYPLLQYTFFDEDDNEIDFK